MNRIQLFYLLLALLLAGSSVGDSSALPLEGEKAETFLKTAEIVNKEGLEIGVTLSQRVTLKAGERSARAIWKTIDEFRTFQRFADGTSEMRFVDSYKNESNALLSSPTQPPMRVLCYRGTPAWW